MANDNTIKTFTAVDIERYHKGQLSAREMHDMEKAALDDPFLADALEGYATPGVNVAADIAELKKRLEERGSKNKVIPIAGSAGSSFRWWKVAAMIIILAGIGWFTYQISGNKNQSPVAQANNAKAEQKAKQDQPPVYSDSTIKIGDTARWMTANSHAGLNGTLSRLDSVSLNGAFLSDTTFARVNTINKETEVQLPSYNYAEVQEKERKAAPVEAPAKDKAVAAVPGLKTTITGDTYSDSVILFKQQQKKRTDNTLANVGNNNANSYYKAERSAAATADNNNNYNYNNAYNQRRNIFRGQVTDNFNNAVPFANITNVADNVGTYTDVKGNFVLTSPDSVLNVQVKSIGYENNVAQLQNQATGNQVMMQEDRKSLSEIVISHKKIAPARSRTSNMVLEEPEPVDGWDNYDTYVANNLVVPEVLRSKQSGAGTGGEVELSFDVDKTGAPVNITVEKSLCESCDKEAVRLIKEGPKWKRKARKKGRTTVTISF